MGYKIWRKDSSGWELAFDIVYPTREKVDERIAELNAVYHHQVQLGELEFLPYLEDIKLSRNGNVIDEALLTNKVRKTRPHHRKRKPRARNSTGRVADS